MNIIVASKNPVKIEATKKGFLKSFPDQSVKVEGRGAKSEVGDQPMTDKETYQGAYNRASNARLAYPEADFWVGIEGGLQVCSVSDDGDLQCFAWIVVLSADQLGKGRSGAFMVPKPVAELVKQGKELGDADDIVFNRSNSKQANGLIGLLTDDLVTREDYYIEPMIYALLPFKKQELY